MSYNLYFTYYTTLAVFIVYRTSEETDGTPKGNSIIIPPPPLVFSPQNSERMKYSVLQISLYTPIYIYFVFISVNTKLVCIFYVSSSMFIIFTFYYLRFLSSVMDCFCKVPFSIILILTMIQCDSLYNSILTKDWGDVRRGGKGGA